MAKLIKRNVFYSLFTDEEYFKLREVAIIDPTATNSVKLIAARTNRFLNYLDNTNILSVAEMSDFNILGLLVSEGILTLARKNEIRDYVLALDE
jgi:hypothetical protein